MATKRRLGKTDRRVSEIGFGAWAIGGSWGETDDDESLRWILGFEAVSTVIPGAESPEQARANAAAAALPPLQDETLRRIGGLYRERIAPQVHHCW